ncbi:MAG: non-canonical purine NTP pyrophosphatase, RdgB/HAM1 family [Thermoprotei archaeon]|nr:MAG: non-canonical purine NTP pyrophosphatase, RdgB/HAM1 family [Thermoprotei archaeon]
MVLRIPFVTKNEHKVAEANIVLKKYGVEVYPVNLKKIEVQSESLEKIAALAAKIAYRKLRMPVVVEDAGLFIDALSGFPGPYSSYVYKTIGIKGVLKLMEGISDRSAKFRAVVALAYSGGVKLFKGVVKGIISLEAKGTKGFGFDPIFIPEGHAKTFAELGTEEKCSVSHRGKAFEQLGKWIVENKDKLIPEFRASPRVEAQ